MSALTAGANIHTRMCNHSHKRTCAPKSTFNASCKQTFSAAHTVVHIHYHTPSCVDGWATRAQFGPDILGQYNTQLLSLITLAGTIKPHSAIAHASQGENLFSLLQRHLSPSQSHIPARLHWGL